MGLAMLAKGPVGLVLPSIVAGAWLWLEIHLMQTAKRLIHGPGFAIPWALTAEAMDGVDSIVPAMDYRLSILRQGFYGV